ncbi:hypothetical protein KUTeg_012569 [Tegillarca granosa]|uniref:Sodium/potassium-transporting ATPase subunit beta n=1 Tax=Tegillarca granosa TaxID=220873 RepID=A0ABQ9EZV9_TEGGR|nr:hypothetical protein KUTeg_012569 [Tegillarca granosa]
MASTASTGVDTTVSTGPSKPTIKQKFNDFCSFLYNPNDHTVLGRGGSSWAQIGLFYIVYYACLAGFWAAMMAVFYQTLDWNDPRLSGPDSLLKQNPDYENQNQVTDTGTIIDCSKYPTNRPKDELDNACRFDLTENLGPDCVKQQAFGYDDGKPCFLLKLNKIYNWFPENYDNDSIPAEIRDMHESWYITVKCEGENPSDKDNIGEIIYYPKQGFHFKYFPYRNQQGFRSPIVMAQFLRPEPGVLIMVECKAYAKNIKHDKLERAGLVHFELLVD